MGTDKLSGLQKKIAYLILFFMLVSLSAMSYVPSPDQLSLLVFLIAYFVFAAYASVLSGWWAKIKVNKLILIIFLIMMLFSNLLISQVNEISFEKWLRSFVPIAFFVTFLWAPFYVRTIGVQRVYVIILLSCLTFCLFLVVFNVDKIAAYVQGGGRLTFYLQDSVVPYPFIGVILATLLPGISIALRGILIAFFLLFVIAVGYKLQIIFLLGFFIFLSFSCPGLIRRLFLCCVLLLALSAIYLAAGDYIERRVSSIGGGGDEVRLLEVKYASSVFASNPFFGGGLGLDVPLDQTRPAYEEMGNLWESDSVSYIHNFPFYLLMVGGVSFALPFFILIYFAGVLRFKNFWTMNGNVKVAVWASAGMLIFFTTSAAFKQIQCVIMFVFFVSQYQALKKANG